MRSEESRESKREEQSSPKKIRTQIQRIANSMLHWLSLSLPTKFCYLKVKEHTLLQVSESPVVSVVVVVIRSVTFCSSAAIDDVVLDDDDDDEATVDDNELTVDSRLDKRFDKLSTWLW